MASCGNEKEKEPTPPGVYTLSTAYDMAVKSGFDGTLDEFIETVRGLAVEFRSNGEFIQWRYQDTETWYDFVALDAITGAKGDPGAQGEKGTPGEKGEKGDTGATGAQGEKGDTGATGAQGEKGDKGETGAQGEKGDTGATGEAGVDGKDGTTPQLKVGEDNYWYVSYDNGKTWTSLGVKATGAQGEKGEKGDTGATGAQGEKGDKGETGAQGEKGTPGEKGDTGVGVAGTVIENGKLFVRLTDGSVLDCGEVVGADGVGIASVAFNAEGELIVTLTDGSVTNCGRPPLCEHTYSDWQLGRAATCTSIGYSTRTCSKCGNVEYAFIEEAEHTFGNWLDMISACTEHWQVRICALCGAAQVKTTDPVGHRFEGVDNICTACGKTYATPSDLSGLDIYNGTYGYEYLGTMDKGEARQVLYKAIDKEVRIFHVNTALNAQDRTVASLDFSQLGLTVDEAASVWKTYKDDNPLYYWLANTVTCTDECLTLLTESEYAVGTERGKYNTRIDAKIKEYASHTSASDSIYRIALAYHDLIIDAIDYARGDDGQPETAAWAHNILGVFDGTGAVCEGYARSFQILLNYSGVENLFVTGMAGGESHAWNLVQLDDGNWYWCDLTWDDGTQKWGIAYNYFCVNDNVNTLWSEGGWEYDETKTFLETHTPATSAGTAVDFLYDLPVRSAQEFSDAAQALLNSKFRVNNCDFTVVGYNTVELNFITGTGSAEIPETVTYDGVTYTVISLGRSADASTGTILSPGITSVRIPKTVKFIWDFAFRQENLQSIEVDEDNPWFRSQDGVLFTKSLYTLIAYPSANTRTEYCIPDETVDVAYQSFTPCAYLETLTLGKNVSTIGIANWGGGYHNTAPTGLIYGNVVTGGFMRIFDALAGNKVILIDENNTNYIRDDFAVYNYDKSKIYCIFDKDITTFCLPANLASIDYPSTAESVFSGCTKLESFTVEEGNRWFSAYDGVLYNKEMTEIIAVPRAIKGDITIPESVTEISLNDAVGVGFSNCKNLTGVTLPETLTAIGNSAFSGCTSLTSITIPGSVTSIGSYVFYGCTSLASITIPEGVTSISSSAFSGCTSLTSITIPSSVTKIGSFAFEGCTSLTSITIPEGVTSIGDYVFSGCTSLTSISIPESVTSIGSYAFYGCTSLTSITIPESVTRIDMCAFYDCTSLTSITIPDSVTYIGDAAFKGCVGLASITLPFVGATKGGTRDTHFGYIFGASNYYNNVDCVPASLKTVVIAGGESIGNYAFYGCTGLTSITIPESVTSIGDEAFYDCYKLIEVINHSSLNITAGSKDYGYVGYYAKHIIKDPKDAYLTTDENGYIFYDDGTNVYLMGYTGSDTTLILPEKSPSGKNYEIYSYAFYRNAELTGITIPGSVTGIGNYAFCYCTSLTSITILEGVTSIGNYAFCYCTSLTSLTILEGITSIGSFAFENCASLASITIPEGVTSIGFYAFENCTSLTSITIPKSVTSIEYVAFGSCYALSIINYEGTMEEWNAVAKANEWDIGTGDYTIHCTDGILNKQ